MVQMKSDFSFHDLPRGTDTRFDDLDTQPFDFNTLIFIPSSLLNWQFAPALLAYPKDLSEHLRLNFTLFS